MTTYASRRVFDDLIVNGDLVNSLTDQFLGAVVAGSDIVVRKSGSVITLEIVDLAWVAATVPAGTESPSFGVVPAAYRPSNTVYAVGHTRINPVVSRPLTDGATVQGASFWVLPDGNMHLRSSAQDLNVANPTDFSCTITYVIDESVP